MYFDCWKVEKIGATLRLMLHWSIDSKGDLRAERQAAIIGWIILTCRDPFNELGSGQHHAG